MPTVKKVQGGAARKKKAVKAAKKSVVQKKGAEFSNLKLPDGPKRPNLDLSTYLMLIYGQVKIGKTITFSSFPDALFLTTEPGTKGLEIHEFNAENGACYSWEVIRQAVKELEKNPDRYQTIVIDTVDRAYDMCRDFVCEKIGIEYPGTFPGGKNDYGKSWNAVRQEFAETIDRLVRTGRGICFTSHSKEEEISPKSGASYTRIYPTMSKQARDVVESLVDIFFYAEYMTDAEGETIRVFLTQGSELIWAGYRKGDFPKLLPIVKKGGYEIIAAGFKGEHPGIDPATLSPSTRSTKTGAAYIREQKGNAGRKRLGGAKKKGAKKRGVVKKRKR